MSIEHPGFDETESDDSLQLTPLQRVVCFFLVFGPFVASAVILLVRRYG